MPCKTHIGQHQSELSNVIKAERALNSADANCWPPFEISTACAKALGLDARTGVNQGWTSTGTCGRQAPPLDAQQLLLLHKKTVLIM